jgi:capsular exopolysaccharide synthesis family protein
LIMPGNQLPPGDNHAALQPVGLAPSALPTTDIDYSMLQPPPPDGGGIQWRRYLLALRRYKWLILLVIAAGTGLGVLATRFITPEYSVQATIWIESPQERGGPLRADGVVEGANWVELLTTFTVLDSVVAKEKLFLSFANAKDSTLFSNFRLMERFRPGQYVIQTDNNGRTFTLKSAEGLVVQTAQVGEPVGARLGFDWTPAPEQLAKTAGRKVAFGVTSPRDASSRLRSQLVASMQDDGNFLRLSLTGSNPARLTGTMNTLVNQYVDVAAQLKKRKLSELSRILAQQVDTLEKQLKNSEGQLLGFRAANIVKPGEGTAISGGTMSFNGGAGGGGTVVGKFFEQKLQMDELKHDREALEAVLGRAKTGDLVIDAYLTIPSVRTAPDLQKALQELSAAEAEQRTLQYRYTDEHKLVQDARERVRVIRESTIPAYTNQLVAAIREKEADLNRRTSSATREIQSIPSRTITEARLTREMQSIASIYTDLQKRYESAKLAEASAIPDVRILDPAVMPDRPTSNSAPRMILMAFMASTGLALALAILLDMLDKRFRYPEQVTNELGLSIFGAIPAIKNLKSGKEDLEEASHVVEAFRTIRLNLVHSYGAAGPVMLTISSPGPGDGKSLVCSNLALSFAEAGYKTLLLDGDIRRGELHRMFGAERIPGLIDYLMRNASLDQVLRPTTHKNLSLLPCGTRRHHGPELLGSGAMAELMAELKARFNVVIIDSPPLGAGIDPFVLGTATGNIMLVLRSGETNRQMAEAKIRLLDRLPIRVLGAVINDMNARESSYQYYSYVYGYVSDEDPGPKLVQGPKDA